MGSTLSAGLVATVVAGLAAIPGAASATPMGTVRVGARVSRGPWSATLKPAGKLMLPQSAAGGGAPAPVISGETAAYVAAPIVYAYSKPAAGWPAATPGTYKLPADQATDTLFGIAVGSGVVALSGYDPERTPPTPGECYAPVFTAGPAGFSGAMTPAACLSIPSDGGAPEAVGANAILASVQSQLQVFAEPAGGWSGTVSPAAQLQASDGAALGPVSMSGTTAAAASQHAVYLFTEPAGGWSGVIHESARLPLAAPESLTLSGNTLTVVGGGTHGRAPVYVLHKPARGWQAVRRVRPSAYVQAQVADANTFADLTPVSSAGGTTAFSGITNSGSLPAASTSCRDGQRCLTMWALEDLGATVSTPKQLPVSPAANVSFQPLANSDVDGGEITPIATDGSTVVLRSNTYAIELDSIVRTAPARVTRATLTGLSGPTPDPALVLNVAAGKGSPAVASLRVLVPAGLGGSGHPRAVRLTRAGRAATVTVRRLRLSAAWRRTVARIGVHGGHATLTVPVQLIDTAGHSSQSQVALSIRR